MRRLAYAELFTERANRPDNTPHIDAGATCTRCHQTVQRWVNTGTRRGEGPATVRAANLRHDWLEHHPCTPTPTQTANAVTLNTKKAA